MDDKQNEIIINSGSTKTKIIIDGVEVSKLAVDVSIKIENGGAPQVEIKNYTKQASLL